MFDTFYSEIWSYFEAGGWVMPPLLLLTILLWYAIGHRFSLLRSGRRRSVRQLIEQAQTDGFQNTRGMLDSAVEVAVQEQRRRPQRLLRPYLDDVLAPFYIDLRKFRAIIAGIVGVAPLLGLLGTVTGMIETFESLGDMTLFAQSGGIAGGISQALFTTQMGLAVAIPGLLAKGFLDRKQRQLEIELARLKDILCSGDVAPRRQAA